MGQKQAQSTSRARLAPRGHLVLALVGLLGWVQLGCASGERPPGTVVFASGADLESANPLVTIHPLSRQVQRHVLFVSLARYDSVLQPSPYLARSWEFSEDRRSLRFNLHTVVRWHDGRPTTAEDVRFTIESARNPRSGYPRAADLSAVESVAAIDDSTVSLTFKAPQTFFPLVLCELPVLPAHILSEVPLESMRGAPFSYNPVGNGPFRFVSRAAQRRWVFERNADFPMELGGPPTIERLVIAVVDEATTKFAGLVSGELDVAGISPTMAGLTEKDHRLRVLSYPLMLSNAMIFNVHRPPFDDARVRRAVSLSIDRERLVLIALAGFGVPSMSPVVHDNPFSDRAAPARGAATADSLLDAAGWLRGADGTRRKDGKPLSFELLTVVTANNELEQLIQADLNERGVRMQIRGIEFASFLARAREKPKNFDAIVTGIPGDVSLAYLVAMFDSRHAGGALDYADYHTPVLDAHFDAARGARSQEELTRAWLSVQDELQKEQPAAWLYHSRGVQGLSRRLTGVTMDLRGELVSIAQWRTGGMGAARSQ